MLSNKILRTISCSARSSKGDERDPEGVADPASCEWLVTNGLGGYASGTASGVISRRFHGLLVAALPAPLGRTMMLNYLLELAHPTGGEAWSLCAQEHPRDEAPSKIAPLADFQLENGLPVWRYALPGALLEKRVLLPYGQNTVHITYQLDGAAAGRVRLVLKPFMHFRPHGGPLHRPIDRPYALTVIEDRYELADPASGLPPLRMEIHGPPAGFTIEGSHLQDILYRVEASRGYEARGILYSPGYFCLELEPGAVATLVASTEPWETIRALPPAAAQRAERKRRSRLLLAARPEVRAGAAAELVLAADQFLITPTGRVADATRARAAGDEIRTLIAGYPWFTDWGRDTMISLEGLTLTTGRHMEAGYILRTFDHYVKNGLLPNMFPEGDNEGLYHTADATLWFFHAVDRYLAHTSDRETLRILLPTLIDIVAHHLRGTRFGIGVDPSDGLLRQGQQGYQLTWMDAKVDDLVVTPRRGKAVEINALWYNALKLLERWVGEERGSEAARPYAEHAGRTRASFNARFWYEAGQHLHDIIDGEHGDDPAFRPNQLFAISLPHPVLDEARWAPVVRQAKERLLTPFGLRSLAPGHPDYKPRYFGDLRTRDMAYHQGTVWAWLIGPFVDAWLKVHPDRRVEARAFVEAMTPHLGEAGAGTISEIFDAEEPFTPRGCVAQAWSVAEALRCFAATAPAPVGGAR